MLNYHTLRSFRNFGILLCVFLALSFHSAAQWTQTNGPYGSNIKGLAIMGTDVFAVASCGVFRSTSNGDSWTDASKGLPSYGISGVVVSGSSIFAYTQGGAFRSTDRGASWTKVDSGFDPYTEVVAMNVIGTTVFAVTYLGGEVYRSTDNGGSWTRASIGLAANATCLTVSGTNLFAGTNLGGVFFSSDLGTSWTQTSTGLPYHPTVSMIGANSYGIFCTVADSVYVSTNNGGNWTLTGAKPGHYTTFASSGTDIFIGSNSTSAGICRSSDNGITWTFVNTGLVSKKINVLAADNTRVFSGTPAGIFSSTDKGATWTEKDSMINCSPAVALVADGTDLYAGTYSNGAFFSADSGYTWARINNGLPIDSGAVSAFLVDGGNQFAGTSAGVFLSINKGLTWSSISGGLMTPQERFIYSLTKVGKDIFAVTQGGIFMSGNNGSSWTKVSTGLTGVPTGGFIVKGTDLFATTSDGIFLSTNNGVSWTSVKSTTSTNYARTLATDGMNVFTFFARSSSSPADVWMTSTNGAAWIQISNGLPTTQLNVQSLLVDGSDLYGGLGTYGVYVTHDTGKNWIPFDTVGIGLSNFYAAKLAKGSGRLYCTTDRGIWVYGKVRGTPGLSITTPTVQKWRLYPNPMNEYATLEFDNSKRELCTFHLYDMQGQLVRIITDIQTDWLNIPRKDLAAGLYYFRLQIGNQRAIGGKLSVN